MRGSRHNNVEVTTYSGTRQDLLTCWSLQYLWFVLRDLVLSNSSTRPWLHTDQPSWKPCHIKIICASARQYDAVCNAFRVKKPCRLAEFLPSVNPHYLDYSSSGWIDIWRVHPSRRSWREYVSNLNIYISICTVPMLSPLWKGLTSCLQALWSFELCSITTITENKVAGFSLRYFAAAGEKFRQINLFLDQELVPTSC